VVVEASPNDLTLLILTKSLSGIHSNSTPSRQRRGRQSYREHADADRQVQAEV
jgi:hypothetical protein